MIACDLRGFGETPLPDGPFVYAADVAAHARRASGSSARTSSGSRWAATSRSTWRSRGRDLVDRLVLVGAGIDGWEHDAALRDAWAEEEAAFERGDLDEVAWMNVRTWLDGPGRDASSVPTALRRRVYEMQRAALDLENPAATGGWLTPSRRERLGDVAAPTLVLVGALDQRGFRQDRAVPRRGDPGRRASRSCPAWRTCRRSSARRRSRARCSAFLDRCSVSP